MSGAALESRFAGQNPYSLMGVELPRANGEPYRMRAGAWTRDADGHVSMAALGALWEHAVAGAAARGAAALTEGPLNAVATHLTFQVTPGTVPEGDLRVESALVDARGSTGLGSGTAFDARGVRIAVGTASIQFVPRPADPDFHVRTADPSPVDASIDEILDLQIDETAMGTRAVAQAGPWLTNSMAALHGSFVTAMLERAAHRTVGGRPWVLSSLDLHFLRPADVAGSLVIESDRAHRGRTRALVSSRMIRDDGKLAAVATMAYRRPPTTDQ